MKYILCFLMLVSQFVMADTYLSKVSAEHNISVKALLKQKKTHDVWPWLVWRGDEAIRLKDQLSLIRYLQNDKTVHFGLFKLSLSELHGLTLAQATNPKTQANHIASQIAAKQNTVPVKLLNDSNAPKVTMAAVDGQYAKFINKYAYKYGVSPHLIAAVMRTESAYKKHAVSHKGAMGLMQVMPDTARYLGFKPEDMFEPEKAIEAGAKYLSLQIKNFGDVKLALAAYNAGPNAVEKYGRRIPPFRETQNYVQTIMERLKEVSL